MGRSELVEIPSLTTPFSVFPPSSSNPFYVTTHICQKGIDEKIDNPCARELGCISTSVYVYPGRSRHFIPCEHRPSHEKCNEQWTLFRNLVSRYPRSRSRLATKRSRKIRCHQCEMVVRRNILETVDVLLRIYIRHSGDKSCKRKDPLLRMRHQHQQSRLHQFVV
jgi:hypothetical protein